MLFGKKKPKRTIKLNPAHKGMFTRTAKAHGMSVQRYADYLHNHPNAAATPLTRRQANFVRVSRNFKRRKASKTKTKTKKKK